MGGSMSNTQESVTPTRKTAPTSPKITRLLVVLLPAMTAMYAMYQGIQQILIPAQVEAIDPANKVANLAVLTSCAAVASMVAIPAGGAVSDRTRSRFGRRTPWIVIMSVLSGVLMIAMGFTGNLIVLGAVYTVLWFVGNFYQGAIAAILPDRVPEDRRGTASALIGLGTPLGILVGVNLASQFGQVLGYSVIALILIAASILLVVFAREDSSLDLPRVERRQKRAFDFRLFFRAFKDRDFALAFVSRFALFMGYFVVSGFMFYTLTDYIGIDNIPFDGAAKAVSLLSTLNTVAWVVVATFCGWLADRLDLRKVFVGISAFGVAVSMLIPIFMPTWTGMILYSVIGGAAIGTYFAVDLALMSLVLPDKENEGRDFGLLAVATGLPQIMSSAIAGLLITLSGGYAALYIFGAVCCAIAAVVVIGIKKVR